MLTERSLNDGCSWSALSFANTLHLDCYARSPHYVCWCRDLIGLWRTSVIYTQLCLAFINAQEAYIISAVQFDTGWAVYIEKCKTQNTCRNSCESWCYVLWVNNCLSVNSQQAVTSHPSHSIADCVNGLSAIPAMYQPQELEQLIEPNKEATKRLKWRVTSPCKVQSGTSLHLLQKQQLNLQRNYCTVLQTRQQWELTWVVLHL